MIAESKKNESAASARRRPSAPVSDSAVIRYDYDSAAVQYLCVFPATSFATNFRGYTICISLVPSYTDIKVYNIILL